MKALTFSLSAVALLALTACSTAPSVSVNSLEPGKPYVLTTDAAARAVVVLPRADGKGMAACAEPSPDVALSTVANMLAQVSLKNPQIDAKTQIEFQTAVIQLTQRSQTILFLRESLWRTCEAGLNQNLTPEQTMKLYEMAMQAALKLADAELTKNKADLAKALQDPAVRGLWNQMIEKK